MEPDKTFYDRDYKRTCSSVGWSLVIFLAVYNLLGILALLLSGVIEETFTYKWSYTLTELMNIAVYLAAFLIPAFFLRFILKKQNLFKAPAYSQGNISSWSLLLIPATIGIAIVASTVNVIVMSYFGVNEAYQSLIAFDGMYEKYQIVLLYISSALVPAFCEEFLFRGTILANLAPYGKRNAVIISSVLFGLMHQNPYQIIYTTVAGILLGMAYIKTNSIWLPTAMHFFNNAYSVTGEVIYANLDSALANSILVVTRILMLVLGVAALVIYLIRENKKSARKFDGGFFGKEIELDSSFSEKPVSVGVAAKGFFRASTVLYIIVSVLSMLMLVVKLLLITYGGTGAI